MEIKVKNYDLQNPFADARNQLPDYIYPALLEFKKLRVPIAVAHNTIKSIAAVLKAIEEYNSIRTTLCETYCEQKDEKPVIENNVYKFSPENLSEFNKKWEELLNLEITIDIFPIKKTDISTVKDIHIGCYETLIKYGFIDENK